MKPGLYFDMDAATYYGDPCPEPSLSQSCATTLLSKSPRHAWLEHPKGGRQAREASDAMARGTAMDALLLGGDDAIVVVDADDFRTKAAKEARDAAVAAGKTPIIAAKWHALKRARDILRDKLADRGIVFDGKRQVSAIWQSNGIWCRGRLDHWNGGGIIDDLKCVESANPAEFARKVLSLGYDVQAAAYTEAVSTLVSSLAGRVKYRLIVVEPEPPYAICAMELSGAFLALGLDKWNRAKGIWRQCLDSGKWPEYSDAVLEPPPWAISDMITKMVNPGVDF